MKAIPVVVLVSVWRIIQINWNLFESVFLNNVHRKFSVLYSEYKNEITGGSRRKVITVA
jgi:hypothetical protein